MLVPVRRLRLAGREVVHRPERRTIAVEERRAREVRDEQTRERIERVEVDAFVAVRRVEAEAHERGADVVELAPIPGLSAPDFLVAKLVYKMIGYRFSQG